MCPVPKATYPVIFYLQILGYVSTLSSSLTLEKVEARVPLNVSLQKHWKMVLENPGKVLIFFSYTIIGTVKRMT